MDYSLNEEQKSMMRSVSKNIIGNFELDPITLYSSNRGEIYHITNRVDKNSLILKVIWKKNNNNTFKNQKKIHCSLKNRYIVQLQNTFQDQNQYYLVLQYCKGGDLRKAITTKLSHELAKQYALQIAKGISYLHKNKVIHHDIRPENILLTANNQIKICDFGRSVNFQEGKNVKGCEQIHQYAPPEGIQKHNEKYDVWSLGCLIYQMVTGRVLFPFQSWKQAEQLMKKQKIQSTLQNSNISPTVVHLLNKIFVLDFEERISIDQLIKHSFFTGQTLQNSLKESIKQPIIAKKKSSKVMFKSLQLKQSNHHNENKQNFNRINLTNKQTPPPNYRQLIEKKMKKNIKPTETSRPTSGQRVISSKVEKDMKIKGAKHIDYDVKNKIFGDQKRNISPLNTLNMRIAPLKIKNNQIRIDKTGITRETLVKDQATQSINISSDGMTIKMKKGIKEKVFNFSTLPVQYFKEYQQCKQILKQIQSEEVRVVYVDKSFRNDKILQIRIMYSGFMYIKIDDELELKQVKAQQLLGNIKTIPEQYQKQLKNIYLKLAVMNKII